MCSCMNHKGSSIPGSSRPHVEVSLSKTLNLGPVILAMWGKTDGIADFDDKNGISC